MKSALLIDLAIDYISYHMDKRSRYTNMQRKPKLGLQYLCSILERNKIQCEIMDQSVENFSLEYLVAKIKQANFMFVGFYSHFLIRDKLIKYIRRIRKDCNVKILIGGPDSGHTTDFINNGCDIICHGEGERTILQIVKYLEGEISIEEIKGISYQRNGVIITNEHQDLIEHLDEIPFPHRDKISINNYFDYYIFTMRKPYTTMMTSRGCPFKCSFCCSTNIWGGRYRFRSVKNVINEIDYLVQKYKVRFISFQDDIFGLDQEWLWEFCDILIRRNYDLHWTCFLHPLSFKHKKEQSFEVMKKAGCDMCSFGLQSANPLILKSINRFVDEPLIFKEMIQIAKRKGILTSVDFIFGLPGETEETIWENINYSLKVKPHLVNFHPLAIFIGTGIEKLYKDRINKVCDINSKEIYNWCIRASRKFYLNPHNLTQILVYILKRNPFWLIKAPGFLNAILDISGLK